MLRHLYLTLILLAGALPSLSAQEFSATTIFKQGMEGYSTFRIPAIVATKSGTLLAFAEARRDGLDDTGNIDLVMRRSTDGGETWSDMQIVWDDGRNCCGNPAPVVLRRSGRVVLAMTWNRGEDSEHAIMHRTSIDSRRVFVTYSDDEGISWSIPKDITDSTKLPSWTWYATGPCHAIELRSRPYRGRIVVPCDHGAYNGKGSDYMAHLIYSDDGGASWHIGGIMQGGNESTVAECRDGSLMFNSRWQAGDERFARHYAIGSQGGVQLGEVIRDPQLPEPVCQGAIIGYSKRGKPTDNLLFVNPTSTKRREKLTLRQSHDGGKTWDDGILIEPGFAAYSDLVVLRDGDVGILYERGKRTPYEEIVFVRVANERL
ncbi:MAG: exo-alpha-sialidase [Alistipes sp.]|nr:exo-alpha-sialidase [Alistipes sp.]